MHKRPTINDIAKQAGVSKRTVSRVINGAANVNPATREKIAAIIQQAGFSPDKKARGLAANRSYLLGIIYDNSGTYYIDQVQRGVLDISIAKGYELIVHPCNKLSDNYVTNCLEFVQRSHVDGVIVLPPVSECQALFDAFTTHGYHYVRMASIALDQPANMVVSDDRSALQALARYLVSMQLTQIAVITGPANYSSTTERLEGFVQTLRSLGVDIAPQWIIEGDNTYECGLQCGRALLTQSRLPQVIFANNDDMAVGVINAAYALNIAVPDTVSVVGFDDNQLAARIVPSLTTVRRPVAAMASLAARKLIAQIEQAPDNETSDSELSETAYTPQLIVRNSTPK